MVDRRMAYEAYRKRTEIPRGLDYLAERLVRAVIRVQPKNVHEFAAQFFDGLMRQRDKPSKSRTPSPEREFEPPTFETVPVTRQPKKSYNAPSATGISVADDSADSDAESEVDNDMAIKCDDFERYAMEIEDDLHSVHYVEATALTTLAANSGTVAILGTTAKCRSADSSPAIRRQRSSSPSPSWSSSPPGLRPPLVGSISQPMLESRYVKATAVRQLAADTGTIAVLSSTSKREPQHMWLSEAEWADHLAAKESRMAARLLAEDTGPPPPSPSPFATTSNQWPLKWPVASGSKDSDLCRIPVGVIEVLDCEPADQRRPAPPKAQRFPRTHRSARDQNIPLPVIHAMEMKSNSMNHEDLFKTMTVQPPSSDRHGYRSRLGTGSLTFDSSSRKPFVRQSNESREHRYSEDEYSAATGWMANMPVFAKCPPAKSKSLPSRDSIPSNTTTVEIEMSERPHGVIRGSSLPYDNGSAHNSSKSTKRDKRAAKVPIALESAIAMPVVKVPIPLESAIDMPVVKVPIALESATTMSVVKVPIALEAATDIPVVKVPIAIESATDLPVVKVPIALESATDLPVVKVPIALESAKAMPVVKVPIALEAATDIPVLKVPIALESATALPVMIDKPDSQKKSDINDKPDENQNLNVLGKSDKIKESDASEQPKAKHQPDKADKDKEPDVDVKSNVKVEKEVENPQVVDQKNENDVDEASKNQGDGGADTNNSNDTKDQEPELDTEYRLTMIHSVREAVNRICEQAVEKTEAIVRNRYTNKRNSNATLTNSFKDRDADNSEAADNVSSEFSLPPPPPPQQQPSDMGSIGQESSWPPPPTLSEAEEERTIAPGYSFDLPDPPTEMDQMDSETDKLDISDEEMKATGLPSDDDDKTDTEAGDGVVKKDRPGTEIEDVMKSTASGGSPDGSVDAAIVVAQDNGADDRAATTIQAVYRGFRARKYVEAVNAAAVKIQAGFRGYRVRQSLKNAAPSTATTITDESQCWSDDDQKSVVSVTYAPLKEYGCEPRGAGDGRGDGDDGSDDGADVSSSGVVGADKSVSGVPGGVGGGRGVSGGGGVGGSRGDGGEDDDGVGRIGVGSVGGGHVDAGVVVYKGDDDDDDQMQTGDDEVFERDEKDIGGGGEAGHPVTNLTTTLSEPANPTAVSALDDAAEAEALVQAAVKIQARVRGFAARKRLNEEKNDGADKQ